MVGHFSLLSTLSKVPRYRLPYSPALGGKQLLAVDSIGTGSFSRFWQSLSEAQRKAEQAQRTAEERIAGLERHCVEQDHRIVELTQAVSRAEVVTKQQAAQITELTHQNQDLGLRLQSLLSSTSWRLSAPLRWIAGRLACAGRKGNAR